MSRVFFAIAFLLGAIAIVWMGLPFVGSDALALTVTVLIGCAFVTGFVELFRFRQATSTLSAALSDLPRQGDEAISSLDQWLLKLHPSLQNSVRLRIEGERVGLPAPVITPYLVGLLVMLGLVGTFLGMVDTLQGAVLALEGTTELEAIRAGLAAPIRGLGLAFGTSVAGVAASAMLGLASTVSRRDRIVATRDLDTSIATAFRAYSLVHNRQETFKAMQVQATALPEVAVTLQALANQLERMGENLGDTLIANQDKFHQSVSSIYSELASSVDKSLKDSLAESGRLAGEGIQPAVTELLAEIGRETRNTHQQLSLTVQQQLETLTGQFATTSEEVTGAWKTGLSAHQSSNEALIDNMGASLEGFSRQFEQVTSALLASLDSSSSTWAQQQQSADQERLALWVDSMDRAQAQSADQFVNASKQFADELKQSTELQQASFTAASQEFESLSSSLSSQWQRAGEQSLSQHQSISAALEQSSRELSDSSRTDATTMLSEMNRLVKSSEDLVGARIETEQAWLEGQGERMETLTVTLRTELEALRNAEEERGNNAVERLASLESAVATQLATLGKELEEPMTRLIETASETPRAAAEVIDHLRREISNNIERDNGLLEERSRIMEELNSLSSSLDQATASQRAAVEQLVVSSADMLKDIGSRFTDQVGSQVLKMSDIAENFAGSAIEMSSLGEAFTLAVQLFNDSNSVLVENLNRIEQALEKSTERSDDQLGYYVAQAREMIDHSMLSQKEVFDELRQLSRQEELATAEAS